MNKNIAPAGIDLDNDHFSSADLNDIEVTAKAAPQCWYGTHQIADGITDEKAVELIEACSPDTVLTLVGMARAALARRAAADAPAADERAAFEAWFEREFPLQNGVDMRFKRDGDQYFSCFVQDRWDGWKARAAHPIGQVSPAISARALREVKKQQADPKLATAGATPHERFLYAELTRLHYAVLADAAAPVCHAPADEMQRIRNEVDWENGLTRLLEDYKHATDYGINSREAVQKNVIAYVLDGRAAVSPSDATGKADDASAVGLLHGYVLMPERLTAENGAKAAMIGEFYEEITVRCPDCDGGDEDLYCAACNDEGTIQQPVQVQWDTIKQIYSKAVEVCARKSTATSAADTMDAARYRFVKTMSKEMLLAWRGMYGCADEAVDQAMAASRNGETGGRHE
jgi:hypothetical protein